jgi:Na+/melibiose symporter-like transporter
MGYVCYTLNIIFQKEKPPTPPSASSNVTKEPFSIAIPKLFKNKNYMYMLIGFGCFFGIFNGLSVVLSFLVEPWFRGDDLPIVVGAVGGSPIISGIIGVTIFGPMQKKSKVFKKWILICMVGKFIIIKDLQQQ